MSEKEYRYMLLPLCPPEDKHFLLGTKELSNVTLLVGQPCFVFLSLNLTRIHGMLVLIRIDKNQTDLCNG